MPRLTDHFSDLVFLFVPFMIAASGPQEFEGEGVSAIVGDNLVSARKRAAMRAQQNAIMQAAVSVIASSKLEVPPPKLERFIQASSQLYMQNYRVLKEEQIDKTFVVSLAVMVHLGRLLRDLRQLALNLPAGEKQPASVQKIVVALWLKVTTPSDVGLQSFLATRIRAALREASFSPVFLFGKEGEGLFSKMPTVGAAALVIFSVMVTNVDAVQGLDMSGARAQASIEVKIPDGAILAEHASVDWGVDATVAIAERVAGIRAADRELARLLEVLQNNLPTDVLDLGQRLIRISGMTSYAQYEAFCETSERGFFGRDSCWPRRFSQGEVWYVLRTYFGGKELASLLERQKFNDFVLKTKSVAGGVIWMELNPIEPVVQTDQ
ncbi:MAG: hypothetical protein V1754_10570 [Pseudomonadota bacterium]